MRTQRMDARTRERILDLLRQAQMKREIARKLKLRGMDYFADTYTREAKAHELEAGKLKQKARRANVKN